MIITNISNQVYNFLLLIIFREENILMRVFIFHECRISISIKG